MPTQSEQSSVVVLHVFLLKIFSMLTLLLFCYCDQNETIKPPPAQTSVKITNVSATTTEAWLNIERVDSAALGFITVKQDSAIIFNNNVHAKDTVLFVQNLLPKKTYQYFVFLNQTLDGVSPPQKQITTMDTTSHNFAWTFFRLGDDITSYFNDICIINDSLAYAVGNIQVLDSTPNGATQYNVAVWNGLNWRLIRFSMPHYNYDCSIAEVSSVELQTIFALNNGKLILTDGTSSIGLLVDSTATFYPCTKRGIRTGRIYKIWGASENDFYAVGNHGSLAHFKNGTWTKVETGIDLRINDIWGAQNPVTKEWEILAVVSDRYTDYGRKLLRIVDDHAYHLPDSGLPSTIVGIWFDPGNKYYIVGEGIYEKNRLSDPVWNKSPRTKSFLYYKDAVRGNRSNDVVVVCDYGDILHYNGYSWKSFYSETRMNGVFYKVAMKDDLIIAVGEKNSLGMIAVGRRK